MNDGQVLKLAKTIWAALFASLVMYLVVAFQLDPSEVISRPSPEEIKQYEFLFSICAVVTFPAAIFLPRFLNKMMMLKVKEHSEVVLARRFPPYLLRLALFESVALYGFVLAAMTSEGERMWPFLFVAAFGFLISLPSREKLEGL